jgi:hypothetical protein
MVRKTIAGWMALTFAAWSVITLAPLLAMHLGHPQTGRPVAQHEPGHSHPAMAGHACCPKTNAMPPLSDELTHAKSSPEQSHRCCFQQAPSGSPVQAKNTSTRVFVLVARSVIGTSTTSSGRSQTFVAAAGSPPTQFSMVLRV